MIRADRELLAKLARLNSDVVPLAMRIMGESVTADEQHAFAERLIAMARQLQARASVTVIDGAMPTIPTHPMPVPDQPDFPHCAVNSTPST